MKTKIVLLLLSLATIGVVHAASDYSSDTGAVQTGYFTSPNLAYKAITGAGIGLNGVFAPTGTVGPIIAIGHTVGGSSGTDQTVPVPPTVLAAKTWNLTGTALANALDKPYISQATKDGHAGLLVADSHLSIGRVGGGNPPADPTPPGTPIGTPVTAVTDDGIYFGVWHRKAGTAISPPASPGLSFGAADAVFYSGTSPTGYTNPGGTAEYGVVGLSNLVPAVGLEDKVLITKGKFTATFGAATPKLTGTLYIDWPTLTGPQLTLGDVNIDTSTGAFNGTAIHTSYTGSGPKVVTGQFFKSGAEYLAGVAKFGASGTPGADTAFGGVKK